MTDLNGTSGTLTEARPHYCRMPTVTRHVTLPSEGLNRRAGAEVEAVWEDIPSLGSVYECPCGATWEVVPPTQYANLVSCVDEWKRISGRRYRRILRRLAKGVTR